MELAVPVATGGSPYEAVLGEAFASLHPHVRRAHVSPLHAEGSIDVEHGAGRLSRVLIWLMKLPAAGACQPVALDVTGRGPDLLWTRRIGSVILRTRQRASGSQIVERSGLGRIAFDLAVDESALRYRQSSLHIAGLRLPRALSPCVGALVSAATVGWHVEVTVRWRARLVCRYAGTVHAS
jgi:hypothetical protein